MGTGSSGLPPVMDTKGVFLPPVRDLRRAVRWAVSPWPPHAGGSLELSGGRRLGGGHAHRRSGPQIGRGKSGEKNTEYKFRNAQIKNKANTWEKSYFFLAVGEERHIETQEFRTEKQRNINKRPHLTASADTAVKEAFQKKARMRGSRKWRKCFV